MSGGCCQRSCPDGAWRGNWTMDRVQPGRAVLLAVLGGIVLGPALCFVRVCCGLVVLGVWTRHVHLDVAAVLTRDADTDDGGIDRHIALAADVDIAEGRLDRHAGAARLSRTRSRS